MRLSFATDDRFDHEGLAYGFFGRAGGVSTGLYDSLNCGYGSQDDRALVSQNRALVAEAIGCAPEKMAGLYQIHSGDVVTITKESDLGARPKADGLVTSQRGVGLAILTADCTPVLFHAPEAGVIGACHAGWRGAAQGIIAETIAAMCALGAKRQEIKALIGPTIAQPSYQVGADMRDEVLSLAPEAAPCFAPDPADETKYLFDLPGLVALQCDAQTIAQTSDVRRDTYDESQGFFSHRRATHRQEADTGRQISVIMMPQ